MSWREASMLGEEIVKRVHDMLRIDDAYLVDHGNGFSYWASDLCTKVTTDMGIFRQGQSTYKVAAETDMIKGRGHVQQLADALEEAMDEATFSGPIYDKESDTFRLYCCMYASSENAEWQKVTMSAAVALQIAEAYEMANEFQAKFHASAATTAHPKAGLRENPDDSLTHAHKFFEGPGTEPSRWIGDTSWQETGWIMEREARHFECDLKSNLRAEFDWDPEPDLRLVMEIRTDQPHLRLGNGLHLTLTVPMQLSKQAIGHLVIELNSHERNEYKRCHTLGSWCAHEGKLAYRLFFPNALYDPQILHDATVAMTTRAIWTDEWFLEMKRQAAQAPH